MEFDKGQRISNTLDTSLRLWLIAILALPRLMMICIHGFLVLSSGLVEFDKVCSHVDGDRPTHDDSSSIRSFGSSPLLPCPHCWYAFLVAVMNLWGLTKDCCNLLSMEIGEHTNDLSLIRGSGSPPFLPCADHWWSADLADSCSSYGLVEFDEGFQSHVDGDHRPTHCGWFIIDSTLRLIAILDRIADELHP